MQKTWTMLEKATGRLVDNCLKAGPGTILARGDERELHQSCVAYLREMSRFHAGVHIRRVQRKP
jgi:hypothetical protein